MNLTIEMLQQVEEGRGLWTIIMRDPGQVPKHSLRRAASQEKTPF